MIQIWKETLLPGTQIDAKSKQPFTITSQDVKAAERNLNRMVAKHRNVPLVWEHQDVEENDLEEWKANYAKNTFGKVGGARINSRGALEVRHDVHDKRDADQLKKTGYVSPKIYHGYQDSQGDEYTGLTIAHVAATPTACQFWQRPFELSDDDAMYLSYTPPEGAECPVYSETFKEWLSALELSVTGDPDEESTVADEEETPTKKKGPPDKSDDDDTTDSGGNEDLKAIVKALKEKFGANISEKVTNWKELLIAIESNAGSGDMDADPEPDPEPTNPDEDLAASADAATTGASGPPMVMSTLDTDPKKRDKAIKTVKPDRDEWVKAAEAVFAAGKCDGPTKRAWQRVLTSCELSVTGDGKVTGKRFNATVTEIKKALALAPDSVWAASKVKKRADGTFDMSTLTVPAPPPTNPKDEKKVEERGQVGADFILGKRDYKDT